MGRLRDRPFNCRDLTADTKLKVYCNQCVTLLHCHHIKLLRTVQQRHLGSILKIRWDHYISNNEVLDCTKSADIKITLIRKRLRWIGHVVHMPDEQPAKALPYGELTEGSRKVSHLPLRYKYTIKDTLKDGGTLNTWRAIVGDQLVWRRFTTDVCDKIEKDRRQSNIEKTLNATREAENENEL